MPANAMPANEMSAAVVELTVQYSRGGFVTTGHPYAEQDADTAAAFTIDGCAFVACARTPRGLWRIDSTDGASGPMPLSAYRYRFRDFTDAVDYVAKKCRLTVHHVDTWTEKE
jgi:hypothetical protein